MSFIGIQTSEPPTAHRAESAARLTLWQLRQLLCDTGNTQRNRSAHSEGQRAWARPSSHIQNSLITILDKMEHASFPVLQKAKAL